MQNWDKRRYEIQAGYVPNNQLPNGNRIADELCECNHLRSQHWDTLAKGHGACEVCKCKQFTWSGFIEAT